MFSMTTTTRDRVNTITCKESSAGHEEEQEPPSKIVTVVIANDLLGPILRLLRNLRTVLGFPDSLPPRIIFRGDSSRNNNSISCSSSNNNNRYGPHFLLPTTLSLVSEETLATLQVLEATQQPCKRHRHHRHTTKSTINIIIPTTSPQFRSSPCSIPITNNTDLTNQVIVTMIQSLPVLLPVPPISHPSKWWYRSC
jgi:hypothetical protein